MMSSLTFNIIHGIRLKLYEDGIDCLGLVLLSEYNTHTIINPFANKGRHEVFVGLCLRMVEQETLNENIFN